MVQSQKAVNMGYMACTTRRWSLGYACTVTNPLGSSSSLYTCTFGSLRSSSGAYHAIRRFTENVSFGRRLHMAGFDVDYLFARYILDP